MIKYYNNYSLKACPFMLVFAMLILSGCATTDFSTENVMRNGSNIPDNFLVGTHSDQTTSEPGSGYGCRNPMVDPRNGIKLQLVRSNGELGDYKVSDGSYGVGRKELLRLDCSTGRAIGIVRE